MKTSYVIACLGGIAAIALAVVAFGGGGTSSLGVGAVARAAETPSQVAGAQVAIDGSITAPGATMTMTGGGHMNFKAGEGELTLTIGGLPAAAQATLPGGSIEMTELMKGGSLYMDSPLFAGKLPNGARWMKLDLASVGQAMGLNPSSMTSFGANPSQYLSYLKAAGGSMSVAGREAVRGVPTTRYSGQVNLLQAMEKQAGANVTQVREAFAKVQAELGGGTIPVEVWVDGAGMVRKEAITIDVSAAGQSVATKMDIEYFNFGSSSTVTAPAGSEVYDLTQQALQGLSATQ